MNIMTLERRYRKKRRDAGEKLAVTKFDACPNINRYCETQGISRSEYMLRLIRKDSPRRKRIRGKRRSA